MTDSANGVGSANGATVRTGNGARIRELEAELDALRVKERADFYVNQVERIERKRDKFAAMLAGVEESLEDARQQLADYNAAQAEEV